MPGPVFDVGSFLKDQGLEVESALDNGVYQVRSPEGKVGTFDAKAMLKDQGVNPSSVKFEVNTPDTARDISPIGLMDRAKLTLGNAKGKLEYLKTKFDDVKYDANKGLVVNNKGIWQAVDPSGLGDGDAWDMTKELVKDVIDLGDIAGSAVGSGAGAALGTFAGPAGSIAGAGVGGGLAEAARTSLGRLWGTYDPGTPEEQIKDIAIESLLNMGGQGLALGAKATLGTLGKAFKNMGAQASETSKDLIGETLGKLTGAGPQATRIMMDQTDEVIKDIARVKSATRTTGEMIDLLRSEQLKAAEEILEEAPKALTREFGKLKSTLVAESANLPKVHVGNLATDALNSIEEAGLIKRVVDEDTGKTLFKIMDDETAIALRNEGKNAAILAPSVQSELQPIINQLNKFTKLGDFEGSQAASTLMDLKKTVNDVYRDLVGPSTSPTVKGLLDNFRTKFSQGIGQVFDKAGLTNQYMSTVNIYQKYADSVNIARRLVNHETGAENFVKKLVSDSGANRSYKDLAQDLASLMGKSGSDKINSITTKEAAKAFTPWLPKTGIMPQIGIGGAVAAAPVTGGASLAAIPASSPRVALNAVKYGQQGLKLLQSLNPTQRIELLQNPELLSTFLRTTVTAAVNEEQQTNQLINMATQATGSKPQYKMYQGKKYMRGPNGEAIPVE
jgi:hypothetical protein